MQIEDTHALCVKIWDFSQIKAQVQNQGHVTSTFICIFYRKNIENKLSNRDCLIWYINVYIEVNVHIVNYILKNVHKHRFSNKSFVHFYVVTFIEQGPIMSLWARPISLICDVQHSKRYHVNCLFNHFLMEHSIFVSDF